MNIEDLPDRERKRAEAERKAKIEEEVRVSPGTKSSFVM